MVARLIEFFCVSQEVLGGELELTKQLSNLNHIYPKFAFPNNKMKVETAIDGILWIVLLICVPVTLVLMELYNIPFYDGEKRKFYGVFEGYIFSTAMNLMFFYPFFLLTHYTWRQRLNKAINNWIAVSIFEEITFQIPHSMFDKWIYSKQGTGNIVEWPFWSYAL